MKRGLLVLLILLIVPFVSASIYTDSTLKTQYNLGDSIALSGYLIESSDMIGLLNVLLSCNNDTIQLAAKSMHITNQQSESFSYNLPITGALLGDCKIVLSLKDLSNNVIEEVQTANFQLTKELEGTFDSSSKEFQLGDKLGITGNIINLNNENINGIAIIYIKKDGVNYIVDTASINGGSINYQTDLVSVPAGKYIIDIDISDIKGNKILFTSALEFDLYDELIISSTTDKSAYLPGDVLSLSGNVNKKTGPSIADTKIEINFEDNSYTTDVKDGKFLFNIPLDKKIKSYYHNLTLDIKDPNDNVGYKDIRFEVTPIPTSLEAEFDKESYIPEDNIKIKISLYDQAHDILSRDLKIRITNINNEAVYDDTKLTTDEISYLLPQFALPGEWNLDIESEGLKLNKKIIVEEIQLLDVDLVGQTLFFKNLGNELYNDKIDVDSDGIVKSYGVNLKPGELTSVELYKLFDEGTHTITVLGKTFAGIAIIDPRNIVEKGLDGLGSVTGYYAAKKYGKIPSTAYLVLVIIAAIVILSLIVQLGFKLNLRRKPDHEKRKFEKSSFIEKVAELRNPKKKYDFQFGKADEQDIKDFKRRMINSINDSERRNVFKLPGERKAEEEEKGPFSMFK